MGVEERTDMAVGEDSFLGVVIDDYLVGVRYFGNGVGTGVTGLEFVGAGECAYHDLLAYFVRRIGCDVLVLVSRLREAYEFVLEHLGGGVRGYGWFELRPDGQHGGCSGE